MRWQLRREIYRGEKQFTLKMESPDGEIVESLTVDVDKEGCFEIEIRPRHIPLGVYAIRRHGGLTTP